MEVASSAVGIASLGIQICQGLLSYYDGWKGYEKDITTTYDYIADLGQTLTLLQASLSEGQLNQERKDRVERCLRSCEDSLAKLAEKAQKLRKSGNPDGLKENAWAAVQRAWYPFRASTLAKLRELVDDVSERLKLALQVLQLDVSTKSQQTLNEVAANTKDIAIRTSAVEASIDQIADQNQRLLATQEAERYQRIVAWLSPSDPWINHASARQRHEPETGQWLLQSEQYLAWKAGTTSQLWLHGKVGCGKTVLCSTVIDDVQAHCSSTKNTAVAMFYFTFSDNLKQSYADLLRSVVAQLASKEPGFSMLYQAYDKPERRPLTTDELENVLLATVHAHEEVLLILDALDESPEDDDVRHNVLDGLTRLTQSTEKLRLIATSRELTDIEESMEALGAKPLAIVSQTVDADIGTYVANELSRDPRLRKLNEATTSLIEKTFAEKADGMFRWAYHQLQELKKLKSAKPAYVKAALANIPKTLDETYERVLLGIEEVYRDEALVLLRWLAYSKRPLTLAELAEATIIDPIADDLDFDNRGEIEDTFRILSGLITTEEAPRGSGSAESDSEDEYVDSVFYNFRNNLSVTGGGWSRGKIPKYEDEDDEDGSGGNLAQSDIAVTGKTRVRLAHFSVKEFLESKRILQTDVRSFHLEDSREHHILAQSCLTYLIMGYSSSRQKSYSKRDAETLPLLRYAADSWPYHSSHQQSGDVSREVSLLSFWVFRQDWVVASGAGLVKFESWHERVYSLGTGIYYASALGLEAVLNELLKRGDEDINEHGGAYWTALQVASRKGHEKIVDILISNGAQVNDVIGFLGSSLQAAASEGHRNVMTKLIAAGAEVNGPGGSLGNALCAASLFNRPKAVEMLLAAGAELETEDEHWGTALQAATSHRHQEAAAKLIEAGAETGLALEDECVSTYNDAHLAMITLFIDNGVDVNATGGKYGSALHAAAAADNVKGMRLLIDAGADINLQAGDYGSALQAAAREGQVDAMKLLIEKGADVNASEGKYFSALVLAYTFRHDEAVELLTENGAEPPDGDWDSLQPYREYMESLS